MLGKTFFLVIFFVHEFWSHQHSCLPPVQSGSLGFGVFLIFHTAKGDRATSGSNRDFCNLYKCHANSKQEVGPETFFFKRDLF